MSKCGILSFFGSLVRKPKKLEPKYDTRLVNTTPYDVLNPPKYSVNMWPEN